MKKSVLMALALAIGLVLLTAQTNTQGVYFQAAAPSTCVRGNMWVDTDDGAVYSCTATDTWSAVAGGAGVTDAQYVVSTGHAGLSAEDVLTGTANQVVVTNNVGTSVLSLPQSIATTSTPQFAALGLGVAAGSAGLLQIMGTGSGTQGLVGVASVNVTPESVASSSADDLMTYSVPANSMSANGKGIMVRAWGTFAANGNNKATALYYGVTTLAQAGPDAINNGSWTATAIVIRTGATTQTATGWITHSNSTGGYVSEDRLVTAPGETLSGAVTVKVAGDGDAANDITQTGMIVQFIN